VSLYAALRSRCARGGIPIEGPAEAVEAACCHSWSSAPSLASARPRVHPASIFLDIGNQNVSSGRDVDSLESVW